MDRTRKRHLDQWPTPLAPILAPGTVTQGGRGRILSGTHRAVGPQLKEVIPLA
jgi:hypothetical protein